MSDITDNVKPPMYDALVAFMEGENVYFQPPESLKLVYPCIVYNLSGINVIRADNIPYNVAQKFDVTIMDLDPNSGRPEKFIKTFTTSAFVTHFISDNVYHDVFTVYDR